MLTWLFYHLQSQMISGGRAGKQQKAERFVQAGFPGDMAHKTLFPRL